jgi:hypothetical protein
MRRLSVGLFPEMMEYFTASGKHKPLAECLAKVSECDVLVVIVAHRYGWKPPGQRGKSVTWLECLEAERQGKEVIAFLVDEKSEWPENFRDRHRIAEAVDKGTASARASEGSAGRYRGAAEIQGVAERACDPAQLSQS